MFYIVLFLGLLVGWGASSAFGKIKNIDKLFFTISVVALGIILSLRYGQGSDYFGYNYIFSHCDSLIHVVNNPYQLHSEIGFRLLCYLFGDNFQVFVFVVSVYEIIMLWRFVINRSECRMLSLMQFFPTYYLTYYFSTIRQGIVIATFIGILLDFIEKGKIKQYYVGVLLLSTIHYCALILLLVPIVLKFTKQQIKSTCVICVLLSPFLNNPMILSLLHRIPIIGSYIHYDISFNIWAILERIFMLIVIYFLYNQSENKNKMIDSMIKLYVCGIAFYFLVCENPLFSRLFAMYKVLEVIIVPNLLVKSGKIKFLIGYILMAYMMVFLVKNINAYINEGQYYCTSFTQYPYITVFNKDYIWKERTNSIYYELSD